MMTNKTTSAIDLVCDHCGKTRSEHSGAIPNCMMYPTYTDRLSKQLAEQSDTITRLQAALEEIRDRPGAGPEYHTGKGCIPRMISEAEKMAEIADRALSSVGGE